MVTHSSTDIEGLARRIETTPVDGKFGTRLFAMSDAERDLVVRLLRSHWDHAAEHGGEAATPGGMNTSNEELLYLADQERHSRGMLHPDDHSELRASAVREWALRGVAQAVTSPHEATPDAPGVSTPAQQLPE
jgi:hypothetical protein